MSCERCEGRWCGAECFAYKQGKADERNRIADALEREAMEMRVKPRDGHGGATALREFAWRLRKGEV